MAGLIETARMTAEAKPDIGYGIDFVAYCLEEPPFYGSHEMGSYIHAESIHENKEKIIGLINFEMIGYFHDGDQEYPDERLRAIYPEKADFIVVVGRQEYHEMSDDIDTLDFDSMREVVTATWKAVTGF